MTPEPVRILHFTDPHLFAGKDGSLRGTVTYDSLSAVVDHIRRCDWPADLAAMTGDLIQDDSPEAYQRFTELTTPLGLPVHCVPGNHDIRPLMQEALAQPPYHYCESVRAGNWLIAGIDSCVDGEAGGCISESELTRLSAMLSDTAAEHAAICLHHPPLPMNSRWLDSVGLANAGEFLDLVRTAGNVRTAIFGHVHQAFDELVDGTRIIGTPSTCAQFKPQADEFMLDNKPPAYRRLALNADGSVETELIWLDTDE